MTINELEQIINLKDWNKIRNELEARGYRFACYERDFWEYDSKMIEGNSAYREAVHVPDEEHDREFSGTLYKECKEYEQYTFISVALWVIRRDRNNVSVPSRIYLFTDAPYNEEYIKDLHSMTKCEICGRKAMKKNLMEYNNKFICYNCLDIEVDKYFNRFIAEALLN